MARNKANKRKASRRTGKSTSKSKREFHHQVWSNSDRLQLLAWLDWCILIKTDFKLTVQKHLKNATGKSFSEGQIRGKLRREWGNWGKGDVTFEQFCDKGTSELETMETDDIKHFEQIIDLLASRQSRYSLRCTSVTPAAQPNAGIEIQDIKNRRVTRSIYSIISDSPEEATEFITNTARSVSSEPASKGQGVIRNESALHYQDDQSDHIEETESVLSSVHSSDLLDNPFEATPEPSQDPGQVRQSSPSERSVIRASNSLQVLQQESLRQRGRNYVLESELLETRLELDRRYRLSQTAPTGQYGPEKELFLLQQISNLTKQLQRRDKVLENMNTWQAKGLSWPKSKFGYKFDVLQYCISDACMTYCDMETSWTIGTHDDFGASANEWSQKCSGWVLAQLLPYCQMSGIPQHQIFAALFAGGLCELVFEKTFPDILADQSPLLNHYRRFVLDKDGPQALRQIDAVSLQSFLSTEHYGNRVRQEKGKVLAEYIMKNLHFLRDLDHSLGRCSSPDSSTGDEFEQVFLDVLELKTQLSLSSVPFTQVFPRPGAVFDPTTMVRHDRNPGDAAGDRPKISQTKRVDSSGKKVKLCLFPALYFLRSDPGITNPMADRMSCCGCYVPHTPTLDLQGSELILKAIVVV